MVVDAPAQVLVAGSGTVSPPSVLVGIGVEMAKSITQAQIEKLRHPLPFFGQEAGGIGVDLRVVNASFLVGDVVVAANNE